MYLLHLKHKQKTNKIMEKSGLRNQSEIIKFHREVLKLVTAYEALFIIQNNLDEEEKEHQVIIKKGVKSFLDSSFPNLMGVCEKHIDYLASMTENRGIEQSKFEDKTGEKEEIISGLSSDFDEGKDNVYRTMGYITMSTM